MKLTQQQQKITSELVSPYPLRLSNHTVVKKLYPEPYILIIRIISDRKKMQSPTGPIIFN